MIEAVRNNVLPLNASQVADPHCRAPRTGGGTEAVRLHDAQHLEPVRRRAFDPQPPLHDHRRDRGAAGRSERRARDPGRAVLRLGLYLKDGKPTFTMNLLDIERPKWQGADPHRGRQAHDRLRLEDRADGHAGRTRRNRHAHRSTASRPRRSRCRIRSPSSGPGTRPSTSASTPARPVDDSDYQVPFPFTRKTGEDHLRSRRNAHDARGNQGDDGGTGEEAGSVRQRRQVSGPIGGAVDPSGRSSRRPISAHMRRRANLHRGIL